MNKKLRQELKRKKFKNRIRRFTQGWVKYYKEYYNSETINDMMKLKEMRPFQNHSTWCSCSICRDEKYSRSLNKKETKRILKETWE